MNGKTSIIKTSILESDAGTELHVKHKIPLKKKTYLQTGQNLPKRKLFNPLAAVSTLSVSPQAFIQALLSTAVFPQRFSFFTVGLVQ